MLAVLMLNRKMRSRRQSLRKKQARPAQNEEKNDVFEQVSDYCRTCLINKNLMDIFYTEDTAKKRSEDLKEVTGLEIILNDGLSQKMCTKCIDTFNLALQFRIKSVKTDQKLRKIFQNPQIFETDNDDAEYFVEYEILDDDVVEASFNNNMDDENIVVDQNVEYIDENISHEYLEIENNMDLQEKQIQRSRSLSGDKPGKVYKCNVCDKEYNRKVTYKAHMRSHNSYCICEECGKRCFSNTILLEHKRAMHGLARIHNCSYCDYSSATKAGLVPNDVHCWTKASPKDIHNDRSFAALCCADWVHERRHTGEREFVCEHCGASFHSRAGLVQHLPIHLPESNYECNICQKREKSKRLLQHHYHKVHKEKRLRYLCPVCEDVFKSSSATRQHLTKSHGVARHDQSAIQRFELSVPDST